MRLQIPYGRGLMIGDVPEERIVGVMTGAIHGMEPPLEERALVEEALAHPIGTQRLSGLAKGKKNVVVILSDHTRPVPSRLILPPMIADIRKGNPEAKITFLVATGCHRGTTKEELRDKLGDELYAQERIVIHDCDDEAQLVSCGTLPSGGELVVNRIAAEADLLCAEGFIEPHFFAGFSGGRKSVLPGIASRRTVLYNHNSAFIASDRARTGILEGNPIHEDMVYAAHRLQLAFICNVVLNGKKEVIHAVSGDALAAHEAGCRWLASHCGIRGEKADIVITSNGGYPLDQNIYQAVKGMTAAEAFVKENGTIIMIAKSEDGHGGESFYRTFAETASIDALTQRILATPADETIVDQWESQIFARILHKARVIYISDAPDDVVRAMHMEPAHSIEEALDMAGEGNIAVIPDGVSVISMR